MTVYIVTLLIIAILGNLEYRQRSYSKFINGEESYKNKSNIYFVLIVFVFLFVGGFRYRVGTDYYSYYSGWHITWDELLVKFITLDEPLIYLLTNVCRFIWNEGFLVIFVESAITFLLVFKGIREWENESWTMPLLMYILYCGWADSFNGVRQAMAAAILFAYSKKSDEKWILKYAIVCFIAFLVHKTIIFMFPVLILANRKIDFKQLLLIAVAGIAMPYIGNFVLSFIGDTIDSDYALHAVNQIRIIVSFVPALLVLFTSQDFRDDNKFLVNMAIINSLLTFSTRNSALMYRFADYTTMYLMLYIPKVSAIFTKESEKIYKVAAVVLYFIYFVTEIRSGNGNLNNFQWVFQHIGK